MDGAGVVLGAWWETARGFFTPATLFLVVNLVIGTIALTSRSHQQRRRRGGAHEDDQHYRGPPLHQEDQRYYHEQEQEQYVPPAPLARTSSVLDRIRSIGLYRFRSSDFPPEYGAAAPDSQAPGPGDAHYARSWSEPAPVQETTRVAPSRMKKSSSEARKVAPAPARPRVVQAPVVMEEEEEEENFVAARAVEFVHPPPQQEEEAYYQEEEYVPPLRPAPLARTSSVLDRLRSFSLYRFRSGDLDAPAADDTPATDDKKQAQAAHYGRTRSEPSRAEQSKKQQQGADARTMMKKSSSSAPRKRAAAAAQEEEPESVDARADNFINSFRQQLQLQRLNSLLNYKEMLNRGT